MRILSLDVSSVNTGFSIIDDGVFNKDAYGCISPNKKQPLGAQLSFFRLQITHLIDKYKPDIVAIEEIFRGPNIKTFKVLSMFRGVAIQTIHELTQKDPISLLAVEARSELGFGCKKEDAFKSAIKAFGLNEWNFEKTNDIVDSIILGVAVSNQKVNNNGKQKPIRSSRRPKKRRTKRHKKRIP